MTTAPSFEAALAELDRILRELEENTGTLEESLSKYARGVELVALCSTRLTAAEQTIQQLTGVDADGKPVLVPFDHAASVPAEPVKRKKSGSDPKSAVTP